MNISINLKNCHYDIALGPGSIGNLPKYLEPNSKILIVKDDKVPQDILEKVQKIVPKAKVYIVASGEGSKSIKEFEKMQKFLLENNFGRTDYILSLGGGVIGDLAGFVAATYLRGIRYINIPTTTLSQIDSSIGGKVAINFEGIKNIIGAFYHPHAVIIDTDFVSSLPKRQLNNGIIEAIKAGLIGDEKLFNLLYTAIKEDEIIENLEKIIKLSLLVKKRYVQRDEKEKNLRKTLNFGHTIGHALESYYGLDKILHGEAIGIGMLKVSKGKIYYDKLKFMLEKLGVNTNINYDTNEIMTLVKKDKKVKQNTLTEIFVEKIGEGQLLEITMEQLKTYL